MSKKLLLAFFMILGVIIRGNEISGIRLEIKNPGEKAVVLDTMSVNVEINGDISVTTYDMTFYNPNSRILEGEFSFPLQEGQKVTRYALDVNGKLREGVAAEKEKARTAYENTIRQKIDPGIIEKTAGNNYKTRIYPIPSNGYKRVVIAYTEVLKNKNGSLDYFLPLNYSQKVNNFSLEIKMLKQESRPNWIEKIDRLEFDKMESGYYAKTSLKNYTPDKNVRISLPLDKKDKVYTEKADDTAYFTAKLNLENNYYTEKPKAKNIVLIWDTSNSGEKRDTEKELALLGKYFSYLGNVNISLYSIDNDFLSRGSFQIKNGSWDQLKNTINNFVYDGGTRFNKISFKDNADEVIFVTDGMNTIDSSEFKLPNIPFIVINSSKESDSGFIKYMADTSNGKVIDLNREDIDTEFDKMKYNYLNLISYEYNKSEIDEVYPKSESDIRGSFDFSGILKGSRAEITVNLGFGNIITETRKILISADTNSHNISKIWAEKKIENLSGNYEKNKKEILKTAKKYTLVTNETSLIVLDRVEDYVSYEIIPPAELLDEYNRQTAYRRKNEQDEKKNGLKESVEVLERRKEWYVKPVLKSERARENVTKVEKNTAVNDYIPQPSIPAAEMQSEPALNKSAVTSSGKAAYSDMKQDETAVGSKDTGGKNLRVIVYEDKDRNSEYINEYKKVKPENIYEKYLEMKTKYGKNPFFYIDTADYLIKNNQRNTALKVLTNIPELSLENHEYYRILGYKLLETGDNGLAVKIFEKVLDLKGEDLQSIRDLAIAYEINGEKQKALELMNSILEKRTPNELELKGIVINEMNNLIEKNKNKLNTNMIDKRLIYPMPVDYRVVLDWSKDNQEIDLWLTQPDGVRVYYSNSQTPDNNAVIYNHTTFRYGPEELLIKKAKKGEYEIKVEYYADQSQTLREPVIIRLEIITNYGSKNEKRQIITRRVENVREFIDIGKFMYDGK